MISSTADSKILSSFAEYLSDPTYSYNTRPDRSMVYTAVDSMVFTKPYYQSGYKEYTPSPTLINQMYFDSIRYTEMSEITPIPYIGEEWLEDFGEGYRQLNGQITSSMQGVNQFIKLQDMSVKLNDTSVLDTNTIFDDPRFKDMLLRSAIVHTGFNTLSTNHFDMFIKQNTQAGKVYGTVIFGCHINRNTAQHTVENPKMSMWDFRGIYLFEDMPDSLINDIMLCKNYNELRTNILIIANKIVNLVDYSPTIDVGELFK